MDEALSFRRCDNETRGRHLRSTKFIPKNELIFCERPLLALQSIGNSHNGALVCRNCHAFVGGPDLALAIASGRISRAQAYTYYRNELYCNNDNDEHYVLVECHQHCGELYCSTKCQQDHWYCCGHELLCTGKLSEHHDDDSDSEIHPLLEFKIHAIQNNEIFLMVADLVATVVSQRCRQIRRRRQYQYQQNLITTTFENDKNNKSNNKEEEAVVASSAAAACALLLEPYLDFTLVPWWTVATAPLLNSPMGLAEAPELDVTLRRLCQESSLLLKRALIKDDNDDVVKQALEDFLPDLCSSDFFGKIIGSFEQNAIGIRRKHPLCHDIIFNKQLRNKNRIDLIKCMEKAGMLEEEDNDDDVVVEDNKKEGSAAELLEHQRSNDDDKHKDVKDEWNYSEDEIASFLAGLDINDGYNRTDQTADRGNDDEEDDDDGHTEFEGDDLDALFTPLDGTAMYSITCKMNHSCDPNVLVGYKTRGDSWGKDHPLVQHCIALRDIEPDEELCISYIESQDLFHARQEAIANYGFVCTCTKCRTEMDSALGDQAVSQRNTESEIDNDNLFGSDDEDEDDEDDNENDIVYNTMEGAKCGEKLLQDRLLNLNKSYNSMSSIPIKANAEASNFVLRVGSRAFEYVKKKEKHHEGILVQTFSRLLQYVQTRNFLGCQEAGTVAEKLLFQKLTQTGSWPFVEYRECYGCAVVVAAIGHSHQGNFITAQRMLDRACILGLPRKQIRHFFNFVEIHANHVSHSPIPPPAMNCTIPNYKESDKLILLESLSQPIRYAIQESSLIEDNFFLSDYVSQSKPVVFRGLARQWPATSKWRHLHNFAHQHGHRSVPIELGSMMNSGGMKEKIMVFGEFYSSFLVPSSKKKFWTLQNSCQDVSAVAYLAQHPLLDQIPSLRTDVDTKPYLCGKAGPDNINIWLGTGGTRTPLHFDSYDNLFVQIVGAKYVRIYSSEESEKLYVIDNANKTCTNLQGNMSQVDCELEDFDTKHPKARNAKFVEVVLLPGDSLFIPARSWHYVRSLSTSISINYWF